MNNNFFQNWDFTAWGEGLGLITLPWIKPFLPSMGLPCAICHEPELWIDLYWQARNQYLSFDTSESYVLEFPSTQSALVEQDLKRNDVILQHTFDTLLSRTNMETLNSLIQWFSRHFLNNKFDRAIQQWRSVIIGSIWIPEQLTAQIIWPSSLEPLIDELSNLIWWESERIRLELLQKPITFLLPSDDADSNRIRELALTLTDSSGYLYASEYEYPFGDAGTVYTIIESELTLKAVQILELQPNISELVNWFYSVAEILGRNKLEYSSLELIQLSSSHTQYIP